MQTRPQALPLALVNRLPCEKATHSIGCGGLRNEKTSNQQRVWLTGGFGDLLLPPTNYRCWELLEILFCNFNQLENSSGRLHRLTLFFSRSSGVEGGKPCHDNTSKTSDPVSSDLLRSKSTFLNGFYAVTQRGSSGSRWILRTDHSHHQPQAESKKSFPAFKPTTGSKARIHILCSVSSLKISVFGLNGESPEGQGFAAHKTQRCLLHSLIHFAVMPVARQSEWLPWRRRASRSCLSQDMGKTCIS